MANIIKLRRSAVQGAVPTTSQLDLGEVAINTFDGKLFIKKDNGTPSIVEVGAGGGGGSMVYPAAGVPISTGSSWSTSLTAPNGAIVGTTDSQTLTNKTLDAPTINNGYTEEIFSVTDGVSVNLDPINGSIQTWTLGASRSPTASGFDNGQSMTLMIDDGSAYTITWPSVTWKTGGGTAPTLNTTGYTVIVLWKVDGILYGAHVGDA